MDKRKPNLCKKNDECCGCTACATICPVQAIKFKYNSEGFLYPQVDDDKCIKCLKCEEVCAFKKDTYNSEFNNVESKVYASKAKDKNVIGNSSSGGMFTVFSDFFLDRGDAVAACKYSYESNSVELSIILDKKTRDDARGSKYIQAELQDSFNKIITFLNENPNKKMLVVGTGCQMAGLDLVLKKKKLRNRVVLIDLICHGAASSNLWKEYLQKIENEQGGRLKYLTFKNKRNGWEAPSTFAVINDKEISIKPYSDWFYMGWSLRESCYKCPYTRIERHSDITIGDYWGIQNVMPDFYDRMGVSLVITHTSVGNKLFECIESSIDCRISNEKDCLQPRLISPQLKLDNRDAFWNDIQKKGIEYCEKNYIEHYNVSYIKKLRRFIKKIIKN